MGQQRGRQAKAKEDKQVGTPPKAVDDATDSAEQPADGAEGISKAKYEEALEEAVKDVHG